ncbi:hypothetical protein FOCC_FOCC002352 [Frankliniella occidentalis]|nr:hypothetical protein FOCC_FOCC002352 [Frankliniella occidentalis]
MPIAFFDCCALSSSSSSSSSDSESETATCSTAGTNTSSLSWSRSHAVTASVMRSGDSRCSACSTAGAVVVVAAVAAKGDTKMTVSPSSASSDEESDEELAVSSRPGVGARSFCRHFLARLGRCAVDGVSLLPLGSVWGSAAGSTGWGSASTASASSLGATGVGAETGDSNSTGMSTLVSALWALFTEPTSACNRTSSTGRTLVSIFLPHAMDGSGLSEKPRSSGTDVGVELVGEGSGGGGGEAITPLALPAFELRSVLAGAPFFDFLFADLASLVLETGSLFVCAGVDLPSSFPLPAAESVTSSPEGDSLNLLAFSANPLDSRWSGLELSLIFLTLPLVAFTILSPFTVPSFTAFLF